MKFVLLMMNEDEDIAKFFLRMNELMNTIRGINEPMGNSFVAQNELRSLPAILNAKVSIIEEMQDINTLKLDHMHGKLTPY